MPRFTVNSHRQDPYQGFKFKVRWEGRHVAGIRRVSALRRHPEVVEHRDGGDANASRRSPGRTCFEPIVLERGVSHDSAFEAWANQVWTRDAPPGCDVALRDFRKDLVIELYDEAGQLALAYRVYRCWVSSFQALPELDANRSGVAIQSLTLQHEGWERDVGVVEPAELSAMAAGRVRKTRR